MRFVNVKYRICDIQDLQNAYAIYRKCEISHVRFVNVEYRICDISVYMIETYCWKDCEMITMDVEDMVQVLKLVNYIDKVNGVHT